MKRLLLSMILLTVAGAAAPRPSLAAAEESSERKSQPSVLYAGYSRSGTAGTRVYVRATRQTPVSRTVEERRITYHLEGAKLGNTNTSNPLPTDLFGPPVSRVLLAATETGVNLVIELSEAVQDASGEFQWVDSSRGATLQVVFPDGD